MAERQEQEMETNENHPETISRRTFLQGVIAASAATGVVATLPASPGAVAMPGAAAMAPQVLTAEQGRVLTAVLNRLIPADDKMPGAGDLGITSFIDKALGMAPHLRRHVTGVLATLPDVDGLAELSDAQLDDLLHRIELEQDESFDILLQATYTGYYGHPQVLAALGAESDQVGHLRLDRFDTNLLDNMSARSTDV